MNIPYKRDFSRKRVEKIRFIQFIKISKASRRLQNYHYTLPKMTCEGTILFIYCLFSVTHAMWRRIMNWKGSVRGLI